LRLIAHHPQCQTKRPRRREPIPYQRCNVAAQHCSTPHGRISSGLDIVRKTLGKHEIATVQTTSIDSDAGFITYHRLD
jgi:hypothetical protein